MKSRTHRYLAGLGSAWIATAVGAIAGLWLTPFSLRFLSREQFAVFTLAGDVLGWLAVLDLGITAAFIVLAARERKAPNPERLSQLASTAFVAQNYITLGALGVGALLIWLIPPLLSIEAGLLREARELLAILLVGVAVTMLSKTFSALLIASQQSYVDNLLRVATVLLRTAFVALLLVKGVGLAALGLGNLFATLVTTGFAVWRVRRTLPMVRIERGRVSSGILRELLRPAGWTCLSTASALIIRSVDRLVAAGTLSLASVTTLLLTSRLFGLSSEILMQVPSTALPMLAETHGRNDPRQNLQTYHAVLNVSTVAAVLSAGALWAGNAAFVTAWVGAENYGGVWVDVLLALNLICFCFLWPHRAVLAASMVIRPIAFARLAEGVVAGFLCWGLGRQAGLTGLVLGRLLAPLVTSIPYMSLATARFLGRSPARFLWEEALELARPIALVVPVALAGRYLADRIGGFPGAILGMAAVGLVAGGGLLTFGVRAEVRSRILNQVRGWRARPV
jgi:O-antigen/teichoic acid export membrane protein